MVLVRFLLDQRMVVVAVGGTDSEWVACAMRVSRRRVANEASIRRRRRLDTLALVCRLCLANVGPFGKLGAKTSLFFSSSFSSSFSSCDCDVCDHLSRSDRFSLLSQMMIAKSILPTRSFSPPERKRERGRSHSENYMRALGTRNGACIRVRVDGEGEGEERRLF